MNLLMICVDDLRPLLRCYGNAQMHSPNIDRLASGGTMFRNAYCQVPVCGASRASVMTGVRPTRERFMGYTARADEEAPGVPTLLHVLKDAGYKLSANPKVLHDDADYADLYDAFHHSPLPGHPGPFYSDRARQMIDDAPTEKGRKGVPAWERADVPDESYRDRLAAEFAVSQMEQHAATGDRFCVGFGSINVHLPFKAPKKYWDLYDPADIELPDHRHRPGDVDECAFHDWQELRNYLGMPTLASGPLDDDTARTLIHGYMAGVSYLDANVGVLLDALDRLKLADDTAVVFWVDHGFLLGEHGMWCKHCLYEQPLHVPLIVRAPSSLGLARGTSIESVVENLDIFPTICELLNLPKPATLQGQSLLPHLKSADAGGKNFAASRFFDGESYRDGQYRYSRWTTESGEFRGHTLFDLQADRAEQHNLVKSADHAPVIERLSRKLDEINAIAATV